jgi:DNA repair exonuclease SbcCD nuclease subunit
MVIQVVRFLHTADWQLGKPYGRVRDLDKRARLKQLRFAVIEKIALLIEAQSLAFVLVAGDLFDSIEPTRADVAQACSAIAAIGVPVFVIPGNHDHAGAGSFWHETWFKGCQAELAPNLQVLLERKPLEFNDFVLFPCPLQYQADLEDPTGWLRKYPFNCHDLRPRLLIAHGSVHGFGNDEESDWDDENQSRESNRLDLWALNQGEIDYIALGDWHGLKQVDEKTWYAGCPEPDRFPKGASYRSGQVLLVEARRGGKPQVSVHETNISVWHHHRLRLNGDGDLAILDKHLQQLLANRSGLDLLLLELEGYLSLEAGQQLQNRLEQLEARLLRLKLRNRCKLSPNQAELRQLICRSDDPLLTRVSQRLLTISEQDNHQQAELALLALRELHGLCGEFK